MVYQASFQDILFVLAGLAWVGYSAYRANSKKGEKSNHKTSKTASSGSSVFDELLSQFTNPENQEEVISFENNEVVATPATKMESTVDNAQPFSYDDYYEEKKGNQQGYDIPTVEEGIGKQEVDSAYSLKTKKVNNKSFDLKRAFIYSEILNNKYI